MYHKMTEIFIQDEDLTGLKGKVILITGKSQLAHSMEGIEGNQW